MEMIGTCWLMTGLFFVMKIIRGTFEIDISSVLLLKACCFFLSHFGTQPPNLSAKLSLSFSLLQMGPTHSHMALLHNIQHIKPLMSLSFCKTSKNGQAVICKNVPLK